MKKAVQAKKEKNQRGEDQDRPVEDKNTGQNASVEKSEHGTEKSDEVGRDEGLDGTPNDGTEKEKKEVAAEELLSDEEKLAAEETRAAELQDRYLRLNAEFDNYKRRTAKERLELYKTAGEDIIVSLLPVLDDFDRAMQAAEGSGDNKDVKEGMELIKNKLMTTLAQKGLEPMNSLGKPFDTDNHAAITKIPLVCSGKSINSATSGLNVEPLIPSQAYL